MKAAKFFITLFLVFIPFLVNGENCQNCIYLPSSFPCDGCPIKTVDPCHTKGDFSIYTMIDFLYWQAKENGLEYALINTAPANNLDAKILKPDFDFDPGVRVYLGFKIPHDSWDLSLSYTHLKSTSNNFKEASLITSLGIGLIPVWIHPANGAGVRYAQASAKWHLHFNVIDGLLSREFCVGKALSFKPRCGLKNAYIKQQYNLAYTPGGQTNSIFRGTTTELKNSAFCIGPAIGFDSRWNLGRYLSLFFNFAGSLLYTHFELSRSEIDLFSQTPFIRANAAKISQEFWSYKPQAQIQAGINLGWCRKGRKNHSRYMGISIAYEGQYWWKQNQFIRFIDINMKGDVISTQADLYFQGLTADFRIDF